MRTRAGALAIGLLVGVLLGAAIGWLAGASRGSAPAAVGDGPAERSARAAVAAPAGTADDLLAALRAELALERAMRETLAEELAELDARFAQSEEGPAADAAPDDTGPADAAPGPGASGRGVGHPPAERSWFEPDALAALGYPPSEIARIREGWERSVMLRLELEDERTRSGERGMRPVMRDELIVERQTREDLGDDAYDAMLFAAGERNRVILSDLIDDAPAADAGVAPGDEVISYDGERVFSPRDLKRLTGEGVRGRPVELRVRRGGEEVRLLVPRGPLGARLGLDSRPPAR